METRSSKKVIVDFIADEDVKHIILPLGKTKKRPEETIDGPPRRARRRPRSQRPVSESDDDDNNEGEELDETLTEEIGETGESKRSTVLFDDGDVSGQQMFGFRTPVRKEKLANKVKESVALQSPATPRTPTNGVMNTPYGLRKKLKRQIAKKVAENELASSSSDSDFSPSESESEVESEVDSDVSAEDEARFETPTRRNTSARINTPTRLKTPATKDPAPFRRRRINDQELDYVLNADEFFTRGSLKSVTSNHTLSRLKTPRLPPDRLAGLLARTEPRHERAIAGLFEQQRGLFPRWMFILGEGYSVVTYGVGSKRDLLNSFHAEMLSDWPVVVVNGFFPSLSIKEIVDSIVESVLELEERPRKVLDAVDAIERTFRADRELRMGLVVHNIDGPALRGYKTQEILSRLARLRNVFLVASVDHINGPAIWDQSKLSRYNFSWWDATTLLPYVSETSFETSLLVQRSGALALSSLSNVYRSLTSNGQGIFKVIVKYQRDHTSELKNKREYVGMPFKALYRLCREAMLVSTDTVLRTQLIEYLDHQLLVSKRTRGGSEVLVVPVEDAILDQFLEQLEDREV